jgi:hypothetical protein
MRWKALSPLRADSSPGESDEDGLRHLSGEHGVTQTAERHAVNQGQVALDQRAKGILRAFLQVALQELGIRGASHHSIMVFPLPR